MKYYSDLQKELIGALVGLARSLDETNSDFSAFNSVINGINAIETVTHEDIEKVRAAKRRAVPDCSSCKNPCGKTFDYDLNELEKLEPKIIEQKYLLIERIIKYAKIAGYNEQNYQTALKTLVEGLFAIGYDYFTEKQLSEIINKVSNL